MARIPMTTGFQIIPEGTYIFRIYDAIYDEEFGKIRIKLVNAQGMTHEERFSIKNNNDEINEGALSAFSYFAKTAMNDYGLEDVDPDELIDKYIGAEVIHTQIESTRNPGRMASFANLGDKFPVDGFDTTPSQRALTLGRENRAVQSITVSAPSPNISNQAVNLDELLG